MTGPDEQGARPDEQGAGPGADPAAPTARSWRAHAPTAHETRAVAAALAGHLRAGDLLVLTGPLGAGKTTFVQGLGSALDVTGTIASPTFVIARVHRARGTGPDLVHVDAYRLGGMDELDALDLDTALEDSVTVVEWGGGTVEPLADSRLEVVLTRPTGLTASVGGAGDVRGEEGEEPAGDEPRGIEITAVGPRWAGVDLSGVVTP